MRLGFELLFRLVDGLRLYLEIHPVSRVCRGSGGS